MVPKLALLLLVLATVLELAGRSQTRRPFSRNSVNRRRWDDPENRDRSDEIIPASFVASGMMLGHERFYWVPKDPKVQARPLSGRV